MVCTFKNIQSICTKNRVRQQPLAEYLSDIGAGNASVHTVSLSHGGRVRLTTESPVLNRWKLQRPDMDRLSWPRQINEG